LLKCNIMEIKEITNKEIWEDFLLNFKEKTFLQSWEWGEFNKLLGNKIWRLGIFLDGKLLSVSLIIKVKARRGTFLFVPHGPHILNFSLKEEIFKTLLNELKKIGKKEKAHFIRIAPLFERNSNNINFFKNLGFKKSPMHASAYESTWKLDISLDEEDLLKNMRKTTRYLVRQSLKNSDIEIKKSENVKDVEIFQKIAEETAKSQKFVPFSFEFVKNEFEIFLKNNEALLFLGEYKKEVAAGALVIFWQNIAFYHQAALLPKYHKIPIAYRLQWEIIKEAKKRGCKIYDFWGYIDPEKNPKHPWAGPTFFKMGFGGFKKEYIKTQDFPLSLRYYLIFVFEFLRKIKRGL